MEEVEIKLVVEIDPSTKQYIDKQIAILDRIHSMREEGGKAGRCSVYRQLINAIKRASMQHPTTSDTRRAESSEL